MAAVTGELVDRVLLRARDPGGLSHPRSLVRRLLTDVQRLLNARFGLVVDTATLTTTPWVQWYPITALAPSAARLLTVRDQDRDLARAQVDDFWWEDRSYGFRAPGGRHVAWSAFGRDFICLYPGVDSAVALTLVYAKLTNELTDDSITIEIPDDYHLTLLDIVEALLLLRQRHFSHAKAIMERVMVQIGRK